MRKIVGMKAIAGFLGFTLSWTYKLAKDDSKLRRIIKRDGALGEPFADDQALAKWKGSYEARV